jgi:Ribosomal protein L7/L12 C-terminal domain
MMNPLSPEDLRGIQESILAGRKIQAIKLYRRCTGAGLKEAKDGVEEMEGKLRTESPEKFEAVAEMEAEATEPSALGMPVRKGCFGALAVLAALAGIVLLLVAMLVRRG